MTLLARRRKFSLLMSVFVLVHTHHARNNECNQLEPRIYRYEFNYYPQVPANVSWDIDDSKQLIYFHIQAEFVDDEALGTGFSDYGKIENADLVLFWIDPRMGLQFQDMHTNEEGILLRDEQQDYKLTQFHVKKPQVIIEFERNYETFDIHDYSIDRGTTHTIVYIDKISRLAQHETILSRQDIQINRVQLLKSQLPEPILSGDVQILHVHVDRVEVPARETTYWCSVHLLPNFKSKHQIVKFEGSISEDTKGIVHHLEVFHCQVESHVKIPLYNAPCSSMSERPPGLESCTKVLGAWAMGAKGISYPKEAGAPIGGATFSRYVMIEIHYNNPQHIPGLIDSSGLKFYITEKLRKYDVGVMELGLEYTDKMALPPHLITWKLHGYCVPKCTKLALPKKGINVFASQLHAHLTGMKIITKHFRNGVELSELNRDDHYSPHFQEIRRLPRIVHVMPGDELRTTCAFQTLDRSNVTLGGFSIYDEMCVNYIHYYPVTDLEVCKSSISNRSLYAIFSFFKREYHESIDLDKSVSYNYNQISWNEEKIRSLRTFYDLLPLSMQCNQSNGERFPGNWEIPIPNKRYD